MFVVDDWQVRGIVYQQQVDLVAENWPVLLVQFNLELFLFSRQVDVARVEIGYRSPEWPGEAGEGMKVSSTNGGTNNINEEDG